MKTNMATCLKPVSARLSNEERSTRDFAPRFRHLENRALSHFRSIHSSHKGLDHFRSRPWQVSA